MINKLIIRSIFLIAIVLNCSCESDVDTVILPDFKHKPVVSAFISPYDPVLRFTVSSNEKLYGELYTEPEFKNLKCFLSDYYSEKELDTCTGGFCLESSKMPVVPGGKYRLTITAENGISAEAECTVPKEYDFSLKADTVVKRINYTGYFTTVTYLRITFNDIPGEPDFYRLSGQSITYSHNINTGMVSHYDQTLEFEKDFFTDQGVDGKEIQINAPCRSWGDSVIFRISLFNTEQSYYLYHKSLKDYNWMGDPFSEASPIFSNIKGGLGIFTSYTADTLRVKF